MLTADFAAGQAFERRAVLTDLATAVDARNRTAFATAGRARLTADRTRAAREVAAVARTIVIGAARAETFDVTFATDALPISPNLAGTAPACNTSCADTAVFIAVAGA